MTDLPAALYGRAMIEPPSLPTLPSATDDWQPLPARGAPFAAIGAGLASMAVLLLASGVLSLVLRNPWWLPSMLAAAGVPVELRIWPGQMHVFQLASPLVSEAKRSLRQIGEYIREATW